MKTIEVFKTNVQENAAATHVIALLLQHFPGSRITLDLEDCDKVLRLEGANLVCHKAISVVSQAGHQCDILD